MVYKVVESLEKSIRKRGSNGGNAKGRPYSATDSRSTKPSLDWQWPSVDCGPWFLCSDGWASCYLPDNDLESEKFVPSWSIGTWFITKASFHRFLFFLKARGEEIPNLTEEEINAKSKANGLAKALVCIQALWFIATCVSRLAQRIPISLLELNTFGHCICAVLIYLLWSEKPFLKSIVQRSYGIKVSWMLLL